jgi:CHASE3 domain sensor protein
MTTIRPADNFLMRNATAVAISAVTLLMILAVVIFYRQSQVGVAAKGWVNHTYEVKGHIQAILNKLVDAETGQRGYMFIGSEEFLEPYNDALRNSSDARPKSDALEQHHSIAEEVDILKRLTSDNPTQQQNLDDLSRDIQDVLSYMGSAIESRKTEGADAAIKRSIHVAERS